MSWLRENVVAIIAATIAVVGLVWSIGTSNRAHDLASEAADRDSEAADIQRRMAALEEAALQPVFLPHVAQAVDAATGLTHLAIVLPSPAQPPRNPRAELEFGFASFRDRRVEGADATTPIRRALVPLARAWAPASEANELARWVTRRADPLSVVVDSAGHDQWFDPQSVEIVVFLAVNYTDLLNEERTFYFRLSSDLAQRADEAREIMPEVFTFCESFSKNLRDAGIELDMSVDSAFDRSVLATIGKAFAETEAAAIGTTGRECG